MKSSMFSSWENMELRMQDTGRRIKADIDLLQVSQSGRK